MSLPSTIPSELRHKHTTRVFTLTYRVCLRYFCRSKRYSQQNSMQKPDDPSSKFQAVSPTHRLRTTHFSGKIIKIIIAPKGHLRRSWPQLGTIMEDLCVSIIMIIKWAMFGLWRDPFKMACEINIWSNSWEVYFSHPPFFPTKINQKSPNKMVTAQWHDCFWGSQAELVRRLLEEQSCRGHVARGSPKDSPQGQRCQKKLLRNPRIST